MNDLEIISFVKSETELSNDEKDEIIRHTKKLEIQRERGFRFRQRQKLKAAAAKFCSELQIKRGTNLDFKTTVRVNDKVRNLLRLPYRWTDEDLQRAFAILQNLEKTYLKGPFTNVPKEESQMLSTLNNLLDNSPVTEEEKVKFAYQLLQDRTEKIYLQKGDTIEPTPLHAYIFLCQNMRNHVPAWLDTQLIRFIAQNYTGDNLRRFLRQLQRTLTIQNMDEKLPGIIKEELTGL